MPLFWANCVCLPFPAALVSSARDVKMEILPKFRFAKKNVVILYQGWQQHQKGRENWLSPVIKATWEARTEGLYAVAVRRSTQEVKLL